MASLRLTSLLAALCALLTLTSAHNIQLRAHSQECFIENLHKEDRMVVTFQVGDREFGGSGNLEIDFYVCHCPDHAPSTHNPNLSSLPSPLFDFPHRTSSARVKN